MWISGEELVQRVKEEITGLLKYLKQLNQAINQAALCASACVYGRACIRVGGNIWQVITTEKVKKEQWMCTFSI